MILANAMVLGMLPQNHATQPLKTGEFSIDINGEYSSGTDTGEIEAAVIDQLRAVFRQPEIIIGTWKAAKPHDAEITESEARETLIQFDPLWDELFPTEQARIVQLLVERVDIGLGGLDVHLRIDGLFELVREMRDQAA